MKQTLLNYYKKLFDHFGPQHWWPAKGIFEIMVGAVLTQNTNWKNVKKAIQNLKYHNLLSAKKIYEIDTQTLATLIRPTGYYNVKAKRLKNFVSWFVEKYNSNITRLKKSDTSALRDEILSINGIGQETCDSILLYALDIPTFVVDAYTYRVLSRHHLVSEETSYEEMKELFGKNLPPDHTLFNEYHALLVAVGKKYCKTEPQCKDCPLEKFLPKYR